MTVNHIGGAIEMTYLFLFPLLEHMKVIAKLEEDCNHYRVFCIKIQSVEENVVAFKYTRTT